MNNSHRLISLLKTLIILFLLIVSVCGVVTSLSENGIIITGGSPLYYADLGRFSSSPSDDAVPAAVLVSQTDLVSVSDIPAPEPVHPPEITAVSSDVQERLDAISSKYNCISVQIAIINDGYVTNTYCYGYADYASKTPINEDTKVRVASLSKVVVGMAAMRAQEEGYFDIDDELSERLGYTVHSPYYTKYPLFLRSFLTHTAGISESASITGRSLQNFLQAKSSYFRAMPNTADAWAYSNPSIRAAGGIIEVLTGQTLYNYTHDQFFEPLDIDGSFFAALLNDRENIATLYYGNHNRSSTVNGQLSREYYDVPGTNSYIYAGGLTISAKDYARLMCVLLRDGEYDNQQILSSESVAEMQQTNFELKTFDQCVVIRHISSMYAGRELFYHTGDAYGVLAFASYDETANEGVVIVTVGANNNARDQFGAHKICGDFAEYLYSEVLDGRPSL